MESNKITIEETIQLSRTLAQRAMNCQPDFVISIKNGGWFIGRIVAQELGLSHYSIKFKKWYSGVPHFCYTFVRFLRYGLPPPLNIICGYLVNQLLCFLHWKNKPKLVSGLNIATDLDAKILLVDDDIGVTGATMKAAVACLKQRGFKNIFTAVIIQYGEKFITDYSVIDNPSPPLIFPWPWRNY